MNILMSLRLSVLSIFIALLSTASLQAQETRVIYLSGTGFDDTVEWGFYCSAGMNSGVWTTIQVPSCWEQQGFGQYNYGHVPFDQRLKEEGHYRTFFDVEKSWKGKSLELVFEGVMTDARVLVNGKPTGEVHQGAFYPFSCDISGLVKYGQENKLEVYVKKFSDNESINQAERKADYWVFGGIFRPVRLEIKPETHIESAAIDARGDGSFNADISLEGSVSEGKLLVEISNLRGVQVAEFESVVAPHVTNVTVKGLVESALQWNPEFPNLYLAKFKLVDKNGTLLHIVSKRIGFRTVQVRDQDGIYINGVRIKYKGVCRHTFHPDYGRTSCKTFSIEVVNLLKDMNMNAVRMSHYPPDTHFLDVCDSLGLFVLDELAGWQRPPYDSVVGRKLLKEMIKRDVNHPCVVMWDNGNEGGWNTAYDRDFKELDIQQREVNHPWAVHDLTNTAHYVDFDYLAGDHFASRIVFFPTEMIHGLYDGGLGAGLEDFWFRMWNDPLSAGGFLWVFADESVKRSDTGELDSDGNHAPDGILGPYHEKEGSFYAIREIWSPVYIEKRYITPEFNGKLRVQNRFHYTSFDQCAFRYHWLGLPGPDGIGNREMGFIENREVLDEGVPEVDPLRPGQNGTLTVPLMEHWEQADVLYLEAVDPHGRLIQQWSWPVKSPAQTTRELLEKESGGEVTVSETEGSIFLESGTVSLEFSKKNGLLKRVLSNDRLVPISNGPVFRKDTIPLLDIHHFASSGAQHVVADFGQFGTLEWVMFAGGLLDMKLKYQPEGGSIPYTGASFNYPEQQVKSVKYLGNGPYRLWKNRMKGTGFNVWEKPYNNTITGYSGFEYPEFKGYYANMYWTKISTVDGYAFTVYSNTEDLFLRLFTPEEAPAPAGTTVKHPMGDISFMLGIPAIGTKFKSADQLGPQSKSYQYLSRRVRGGALQIDLTFDFRANDH
jgi:hypothetical protein